MPNISMCKKKDCPSFGMCYRAQAEPNEPNQTYDDFDNAGESCCDDYIPVNPSWKIRFINL